MRIYDMKSYYVMHALLDTDELHPISSAEIAKALHVSNKTVQNTLLQIQGYCRENGFEIVAKRGSGLYARMVDIDKASVIRRQLDIFFSQNYLKDDRNSFLISSFCLYLINKDTPTTVDDLCEVFFLSRSTVYAYLAKAKEILSHGRLDLANDSGRRIRVNASEYAKRLYVAFSIGSNAFQYDLERLFGADLGLQGYLSDHRECLNALLRQFGISFDDEEYYIFIVLLAYSCYRYQRGDTIAEDEAAASRLGGMRALPAWRFVEQLALTLQLPLSESAHELYPLVGFVITFNTNLEDISPSSIGQDVYEGYLGLRAHLDASMRAISPDLCETSAYQKGLSSLAYRMRMLERFDYYDRRLSYSLIQSQTANALTKYLSRLVAESIAEYYGRPMSHRASTAVCLFVQDLLLAGDTHANGVRVLVVSKNGRLFSTGAEAWLYDNLEPPPAAVDFRNLYEADARTCDAYDMVLTDYRSLSIPVRATRVCYIDQPLSECLSLFGSYSKACRGEEVTAEGLAGLFDQVRVFRSIRIGHTDEFLVRLDSDLDGLGDVPIRTIRRRGWPINYVADTDRLIVPFLYREEGEHKNLLYIYFNESGYGKYSVMVFISLHCDFSIASLLRLHGLFESLHSQEGLIEEVAEVAI